MEKIWKYHSYDEIEYESLYKMLSDYANQLSIDTDGKFKGRVSSLSNDNGLLELILSIITPELNNYKKELLRINTISLTSLYPINISYISQFNPFSYVASSFEDLRKMVLKMIELPETSKLLGHLNQLTIIKNKNA